MNEASQQKRLNLERYIQQEVMAETSVKGIVAIGSVAKGTARCDSDIDAFVFLEPFDQFAVPAECKWKPDEGTFHGIFSNVKEAIQLDFHRLDLKEWSNPLFIWPETVCAELSEGWMAFDRHGDVQKLISERTHFCDAIRQTRLDDAIANLDWLLNDTTIDRTWESLGVEIAHYRLHSAFEYLVQALFAYNYRWRTLKSREMSDLLRLPWLPDGFEEHLLLAANALGVNQKGYQQRVSLLLQFFNEIVSRCQADGLYGDKPVYEAFRRLHDEPGRDWNMNEWSRQHCERKESKP
jgi:predicted nucleotidyltransferase